jgi:hypothetical protein
VRVRETTQMIEESAPTRVRTYHHHANPSVSTVRECKNISLSC